jgi:hypothetical protein
VILFKNHNHVLSPSSLFTAVLIIAKTGNFICFNYNTKNHVLNTIDFKKNIISLSRVFTLTLRDHFF